MEKLKPSILMIACMVYQVFLQYFDIFGIKKRNYLQVYQKLSKRAKLQISLQSSCVKTVAKGLKTILTWEHTRKLSTQPLTLVFAVISSSQTKALVWSTRGAAVLPARIWSVRLSSPTSTGLRSTRGGTWPPGGGMRSMWQTLLFCTNKKNIEQILVSGNGALWWEKYPNFYTMFAELFLTFLVKYNANELNKILIILSNSCQRLWVDIAS